MGVRGNTQLGGYRRRASIAAVLLVVLLGTVGCAPTMITSSHGYVLVRTQEGVLAPLPDDDPLYAEFERVVLDDVFLRSLISLFEHTTEAYLATDLHNPLRQTAGNYPVLVLDSAAPGVLYDITLQSGSARVPLERALGLGRDGAIDLVQARDDLASASAPWLLELVGVPTRGRTTVPLDQPATPEEAVVTGFVTAVSALHSGARAVNALAPAQLPPATEALRTPGVCAWFLARLAQQTGPCTPQRYMLWFMHYDGPELPLAKLMRVYLRMAQEENLAIETLIRYYVEFYPAERTNVLALAEEVFGCDLASR